ncbi:lipocalin family protein [Desulfosoma caldarium]|uniref:Apolipoprotein D and lipocalin family protein n=1 Tax=Desulfosoma caldarium TaxID=610254 RepID=A0A3N1ULV6_9BACT|nr:lipocalin family protein [Desulfosoma caldarium]ROQ92195.1 apolipoprotein D and lipocalin family protein [Desulfosoma caldarium]
MSQSEFQSNGNAGAMVFLLALWISPILLFVGCAGTTPSDPNHQPVPMVDLERYQGKWYEIASLPAWFQKGCFCTTAEYILEKNYVRVINRCRKGTPDGKWNEAVGKARPVEGSNNARLKVRFFWPFDGDYWVIALDPHYQWAVVGHPKKQYLWILSRTPRMDTDLLQDLVARARSMGYPVDHLKRTDQSCNEDFGFGLKFPIVFCID